MSEEKPLRPVRPPPRPPARVSISDLIRTHLKPGDLVRTWLDSATKACGCCVGVLVVLAVIGMLIAATQPMWSQYVPFGLPGYEGVIAVAAIIIAFLVFRSKE